MTLPAGETPVCVACFKLLTDEERHYYEYRCEACEQKFSARLAYWRQGGADTELDALFGHATSA